MVVIMMMVYINQTRVHRFTAKNVVNFFLDQLCLIQKQVKDD